MVPIKNSSTLNILLPNTNKALSLVTKNLSNKDLELISKNTDLKSIINTLFKQTIGNSSKNNELLQIIKNNHTLKNLGEISITIKDLIKTINSDKNLGQLEKSLKTFLTTPADSNKLDIKDRFKNSGIFLESKLKYSKDEESIKDILRDDLKATLLKANKEISNKNLPNQVELTKNIDKLLLQIDYHQLISHLSYGSSLFIPFSWDLLEKGSVEIKKLKDDSSFCDINLILKKFGELNLRIILENKNQLYIEIYSNSNDFKELIRDNLPILCSALLDINISPKRVKMYKIKKKQKDSPYQEVNDNLNLGFEVTG